MVYLSVKKEFVFSLLYSAINILFFHTYTTFFGRCNIEARFITVLSRRCFEDHARGLYIWKLQFHETLHGYLTEQILINNNNNLLSFQTFCIFFFYLFKIE